MNLDQLTKLIADWKGKDSEIRAILFIKPGGSEWHLLLAEDRKLLAQFFGNRIKTNQSEETGTVFLLLEREEGTVEAPIEWEPFIGDGGATA